MSKLDAEDLEAILSATGAQRQSVSRLADNPVTWVMIVGALLAFLYSDITGGQNEKIDKNTVQIDQLRKTLEATQNSVQKIESDQTAIAGGITRLTEMVEKQSELIAEIRVSRFKPDNFREGVQPIVDAVSRNAKELEYRRDWMEKAETRLSAHDVELRGTRSDIHEIKQILKGMK